MFTQPEKPRRGSLPILEIIGSLLLLAATLLLVTQLSGYSKQRQNLPYGLSMGGVPVGGLSQSEARAYLEEVYGRPITVTYGEESIQLLPEQLGFRVNTDAMLAEADRYRSEGTFWSGFWDYLWQRPFTEYDVPLMAEYSDDLLKEWILDVATRYDRPPGAMSISESSPAASLMGQTLNQQIAFERLDAALTNSEERSVELPVNTLEAERPGIDQLEAELIDYIIGTGFLGVASVQVIDLQTGEEVAFNLDLRTPGSPQMPTCDIAYAATSTMKINVMVEYFRYLYELPLPFELEKVEITMIQSGNWSANSMLLDIGYGDQLAGATTVTNSVQSLGLTNTFMVAPYDEEEPPTYFSTPAREAGIRGDCVNTLPDAYMQTTVHDLASMLDMVYLCAEHAGGGLIARYPGEITQADCQLMLSIMERNIEGQLIMAGVPEETPVAHKHGWTYDTHGDAGIVFSPGGDYVIAMFVWAPVDWLAATITFPILEGISARTFNYFNPNLIDAPRRGLDFELEG